MIIMAELFILFSARVYFIGVALLLLNSLSGLLFRPTGEEASKTVSSVLLVPVWPLALFSAPGRERLLKRVNTL